MNINETKIIIENPEYTLLERTLLRVSHRQPKIGGKIDLGLFRANDIPEHRNQLCLTITKPGREMFTTHSKIPFTKKGDGKIYAVTVYRLRDTSSGTPKYRITAKAISNQ